MPADTPLIQKAEAATGKRVRASARARLTRGDELMGARGVLCAAEGCLAFVEDRLVGPGETTIVERDGILQLDIRAEAIGETLVVRARDRALTFGHLGAGTAAHLLHAAGLQPGSMPEEAAGSSPPAKQAVRSPAGPAAQPPVASPTDASPTDGAQPAARPPAEPLAAEQGGHPARVEIEQDGWVEEISWQELIAGIRSGRYKMDAGFRPARTGQQYAQLQTLKEFWENHPDRERARDRERERAESEKRRQPADRKREPPKPRRTPRPRRSLTWFGTEDAIFTAGVNTRGFIVFGVNVSGVVAIGVNSIGVIAVGVNCLGSILSLGLNTAAPLAVLGMAVASAAGPGNGWIAPRFSVPPWSIPVTTVVLAAVMGTIGVMVLRGRNSDPDARLVKTWQGWGFVTGAVVSLLSNFLWLVEPHGPATVQEQLVRFLFGPGGFRP